MKKHNLYIGGASGAVFCFDKNNSGIHYGRVYHRYSREPVIFEGFLDMIEKMERFYDEIQCPFPATERRRFPSVANTMGTKRTARRGQRGGRSSEKKENYRYQKREQIMSDEELLQKHGDEATFIVQVQQRQNSTWQGRVTWVERRETVYFRSALELIEMIDEAVGQVSKADSDEQENEA